MIFIRERCYFSLVCTSRKAIKKYEEKVVVQTWALRFSEEFDNICINSPNSLLSYGNSP
jgi:hypothetical protein